MLAALLALCAPMPVEAGRKPPMPPALKEALAALKVIEFNFEHGKWKEAEKVTMRLERLLGTVIDSGGSSIAPRMIYDFGYSLGKLRGAMADRDRGKTYEYFMEVYDQFLRLSVNFDSPVPAALEIVDFEVQEAKRYLAEGNYAQVVYEMKEVSRYFRNLYALLEAQGIDSSNIWGYHRQINQVMAAAEVGDRRSTSSALERLALQTRGFLDVFLDGQRSGEAGSAAGTR